jgi:hypothetical protein
MKKNIVQLVAFILSLIAATLSAQPVTYITDSYLYQPTTWVSDTTYVLQTVVTVMPGSSLTICPGTKVLFDTTAQGYLTGLRVARGGKIYADGSVAPIVFTSARANPQPGDWLGVRLFGHAPDWCAYTGGPISFCIDFEVWQDTLDHFGGERPNDTSGVFRFVRIEYAGGAQPGTTSAGRALLIAGIGSGTRIDHIEVYKSDFVGYDFQGGTVGCKYLIANQCNNSDFRFGRGYQGNLQFLYSLRDPHVCNTFTNAFNFAILGDSFFVKPILSNITVAGPVGSTIASGYNRLIRLYFGTQVGLFNSVLCGKYPTGVYYDGSSSPQDYLLGDSIEIKNTLLAGPVTPLRQGIQVPPMLLENWFLTPSFSNHITSDPYFAGLLDPFNLTAPNPLPAPGAWVWNKSSFSSSPRLSDPFFEKVNFIGAFGSTDWTYPWATWHHWTTGPVSCLSGTQDSGISPVFLRVFPQPASDRVVVKGNFPKNMNPMTCTVQLTDLLGRPADIPHRLEYVPEGLQLELDIRTLFNGMYVIRIQGEGFRGSGKLFVVH